MSKDQPVIRQNASRPKLHITKLAGSRHER